MKILIADDHKLLRESLKVVLETNTRMKVVGSASNGMEAYQLCEQCKPDLVLMDIAMPVCDGIQATKLIKSEYPHIKILILTASSENFMLSKALNYGADGYILKDVGKEELMLSIESTFKGLGIIQRELLDTLHKETNKPMKSASNNSLKLNDMNVILSNRQLQILSMIVEGYDNKQISKSLYIAEGTVKNNISEIISKLQLKDRTQLAIFAIRHDLV